MRANIKNSNKLLSEVELNDSEKSKPECNMSTFLQNLYACTLPLRMRF